MSTIFFLIYLTVIDFLKVIPNDKGNCHAETQLTHHAQKPQTQQEFVFDQFELNINQRISCLKTI